MALKWQNNSTECGILRKNDTYENKEDLLVFGYSCKLFRDDEKALLIDQGKHLIPWMGDESLKIDRYDCRGNLGARELAAAEARGEHGVDWLQLLGPDERRAEKLCDEERYRALHTDEDEEEMYREEELKRLHMAHNASYGQVQFNYDGDAEGAPTEDRDVSRPEDDEPFVPSDQFAIPEGMPIPETKKLNAIVEKTAMFIASQGPQMEILLKAKQAGNPQFLFLSLECPLHAYYSLLLAACREGRFPRENPTQDVVQEAEHYLHPSLAPVPVESAPSIPSILYKPSADCAYSMLVNQIKGKKPETRAEDSAEPDIAPPGTETLPLPIPKRPTKGESAFSKMDTDQLKQYAALPLYTSQVVPDISKAAVMYNTENQQSVSVPSETNANSKTPVIPQIEVPVPLKKPVAKPGALKLIHYSDSEGDSDSSDSGQSQSMAISIPGPDLQVIIDKMASYVAKNGDAFETIVKTKGDPRFSFLDPQHQFYGYYRHKRAFYEKTNRGPVSSASSTAGKDEDIDAKNEQSKEEMENKAKAPVSFSIKKMKEPEPILPKPALPYESSSDEESKDAETPEKNNTEDATKSRQPVQPLPKPSNEPPPAIPAPKTQLPVPKVEPIVTSLTSVPKPSVITNSTTALKVTQPKPVPPPQSKIIYHVQNEPKSYEKAFIPDLPPVSKLPKMPTRSEKPVHEKRHASNQPDDSSDRRKRKKNVKRHSAVDSERAQDVITIDEDITPENQPDCIDLTDDFEDKEKRGEYEGNDKNRIQIDRKRRAAAFLSSLKDLPSVPTDQQSTLASAMVKTLNTYKENRSEDSRYRRRRRDDGSRRKSKRGDSRDRYSESADEGESERSSRHRSSSSRKHPKKSKNSSKDERFAESHSNRDEGSKHRSLRDHSSKEGKTVDSLELKNLEEEFKKCRKQDKLLTSSLKELVKEARKDLISQEPIKMAVDIFSMDSSNDRSPACSSRQTQADDWEKESSEEAGDDSVDSSTSEDSE